MQCTFSAESVVLTLSNWASHSEICELHILVRVDKTVSARHVSATKSIRVMDCSPPPPVDIFEVAEVGEAAGHIRRHGGQPPVGDLVKLVPVPLRDQVPPRQQISTSGSVWICVDIYP